MRKFTQKEIRNYIASGLATDITNAKDVGKMDLETIGLSFGVYGMNAGLFQDRETGEFYVVRNRSTNLFILA